MSANLSTPDLEAIYDALADGVDRAGPGRGELFLAKLALLLAQQVGDRQAVLAAVDAALQDL